MTPAQTTQATKHGAYIDDATGEFDTACGSQHEHTFPECAPGRVDTWGE